MNQKTHNASSYESIYKRKMKAIESVWSAHTAHWKTCNFSDSGAFLLFRCVSNNGTWITGQSRVSVFEIQNLQKIRLGSLKPFSSSSKNKFTQKNKLIDPFPPK